MYLWNEKEILYLQNNLNQNLKIILTKYKKMTNLNFENDFKKDKTNFNESVPKFLQFDFNG